MKPSTCAAVLIEFLLALSQRAERWSPGSWVRLNTRESPVSNADRPRLAHGQPTVGVVEEAIIYSAH